MSTAVTTRVPPSRVLLVACFGAFLAFLDATIVNVAFPSIRESFPDTSIGGLSWVLNAYNIVFAAFLIVCGRLTDLLGRRRSFVGGVVLFTVASAAVRTGPVGRAPRRRPRPAGPGRRHARAGVARARRRRLPGRAPRPRHRPLGRVGRGRRRARPADRRRPGRARRLALGLPRQPPLRPGRGVGGAAASSSRAGPRDAGRCPTCVGAALLVGRAGPLNLGIVKGSDWGWSQRRRPRLASSRQPCCPGLFVLSSRGTARRCSTRRCCGCRRSASGPTATVAGRLRLLRLPADQHPVAAVRLGVRRPARRTRPGARARWSPRSSPPGSARSPTGTATGVFVVPGALVWAGRVPLVPPAGRARAGVLGGVAARARCSAASASVRPCRCSAAPRWPPSPAAGTPPPRPSCPARASSAGCWASPCSS